MLQVVQAADPVLGHLGNLLWKDRHARGYLPHIALAVAAYRVQV